MRNCSLLVMIDGSNRCSYCSIIDWSVILGEAITEYSRKKWLKEMSFPSYDFSAVLYVASCCSPKTNMIKVVKNIPQVLIYVWALQAYIYASMISKEASTNRSGPRRISRKGCRSPAACLLTTWFVNLICSRDSSSFIA